MGIDVGRTVTYQDGKVLHRTTYYSHYSRVTGVLLIGRGRRPGRSGLTGRPT
ncbi:MAG TPA: hypothetical protein VHM48_13110 [Candidatus Limnocylindrales bacterium]|nr:hypothetical protein [Candidatus Limnocylindrales bacterium]